MTVCSYVNRGQRRGITGEYHATQAQTNEMARNEAAFAQTQYNWQFESSDRAFRGVPSFRQFINSNRTSCMGELPIRCQLKRPYFTLPGYFYIFLPRRYFTKENLTRFALTGLELARPAYWRQNMTNHKTRTLILGLFFEARGPPYAFYLISLRPLDEPRNVGNVCPVYNSSLVPAWDEHVIVFVP